MTFELIFKLMATIFGSLGFWELIKYIISSRRNKKTAEAEALLSIAQYLLYPQLERIYFRGVVGYDEYEMIASLYSAYKRLGGNGTIARRFETLQTMEKVKDEELDAYDRGIVRKDLIR